MPLVFVFLFCLDKLPNVYSPDEFCSFTHRSSNLSLSLLLRKFVRSLDVEKRIVISQNIPKESPTKLHLKVWCTWRMKIRRQFRLRIRLRGPRNFPPQSKCKDPGTLIKQELNVQISGYNPGRRMNENTLWSAGLGSKDISTVVCWQITKCWWDDNDRLLLYYHDSLILYFFPPLITTKGVCSQNTVIKGTA